MALGGSSLRESLSYLLLVNIKVFEGNQEYWGLRA